MLIEHAQFHSSVDVPQADGMIARAAEENLCSRVRGQAENRSLMSVQGLQALARFQRPRFDRCVLRARDDEIFRVDVHLLFEVRLFTGIVSRRKVEDR